MITGVLKEIKSEEYRVAMTPAGAMTLVQRGHTVLAETQCGAASGFSDDDFRAVGAEIVGTAAELYARAELVLKVKEPMPVEFPLLRAGQTVFTYFHFAASEELTRAVIASGCSALAYETLETPDGKLPLLTPMSEVAGRMAVQQGAKLLEREMGGRGILLGGVPGVPPATVTVLGGGIVGANAAKVAAGLGARVFILDTDLDRLRYLADVMPANVVTLASNAQNIRDALVAADLVISGVLLRGAKAPKLVTRDLLRQMKRGAVVIDVAIDQGGSMETSRPTTHKNPTYVEEGIVHYCVTNMPGAMPLTSTLALTNATLRWTLLLADKGTRRAILEHPPIAKAANIIGGHVTYKAVADVFGLPYVPAIDVVQG